MHLYKTTKGIILSHQQKAFLLEEEWDDLINQSDLFQTLLKLIRDKESLRNTAFKRIS